MPFIIVPRRRRSGPTPKWAAALGVLIGLGLSIFGVTQLGATPDCEGKAMHPGDRCAYTKSGESKIDHINTYEDERDATHRDGLLMIGVGVVMAGASAVSLSRPTKVVRTRSSAAMSQPRGGGSPMSSAYASQIAAAANASRFPPAAPPPPPPPAAPPGAAGPLHHDA